MRRNELPPQLPRAFSVAEAIAAGVWDGRLDAADLTQHFRGARIRADGPLPTLTWFELRHHKLRELCAAYLPVAPADALFSHVTAAALYGMPLPHRLNASPSLHVITAGTPPRRKGIVGHSGNCDNRRVVGGLPVVSPEIAWLQLAGLCSLDELVVAGDFLVRRKHALSTVESLANALAGASGSRGVRRAEAALRDVRWGTDSPPESWMRVILIRDGLPEPIVRFTVYHDGYFVGTPDLAYPAQRIALEYQGGGHRDEAVFEDDIVRLDLFHEAGWKVLQVTRSQLLDPVRLAIRVRRALAERS